MNTKGISKFFQNIKKKHLLRKLSRKIFLSHINSLLLLAVLSGVITGFLSVLFRTMLEHSGHFVKLVTILAKN